MRFLLVDEIVHLAPGRTIHGQTTLHAAEPLFQDHFPGFPVVPGVLLVEMMAQTAGKCLDAEDRGRGKAMLVQIRNASFREWARPDQLIDIHADVTSSMPDVARASCRVAVEGRDIAAADLLFAFVPYTRLADGYRDEVLERYLETHPHQSPS